MEEYGRDFTLFTEPGVTKGEMMNAGTLGPVL